MFKFVWLDGKTESMKGKNVADAFSKLGYNQSSVKALDHYEETKKVIVNNTNHNGFPMIQ